MSPLRDSIKASLLSAAAKAGERQTDHIAFELNDIRTLRDKLKANRAEFFQDLHDAPYGLTVYVAGRHHSGAV